MNNIGESFFQGAMQTVQNAVHYLPEPLAQGVDFAGSLLRSDNTTTIEFSDSAQELINRQIEVQLELQQVTFVSNIERSEHEGRMAAVRNIRVG
ncbi:MAG: hypothetical protein KDD69_17260 [Bdellovibrionales bacterium]|nr:hypothetical protein [Bdellovibrionales bacterium]